MNILPYEERLDQEVEALRKFTAPSTSEDGLRNFAAALIRMDVNADATQRVQEFIIKHKISCAETIHQSDRVIENAYQLIEDLATIVGYYKDPDDESDSD